MYVKQHSYELLFYNVELRLDGILFDYYSGILFNYYLQSIRPRGLKRCNRTVIAPWLFVWIMLVQFIEDVLTPLSCDGIGNLGKCPGAVVSP